MTQPNLQSFWTAPIYSQWLPEVHAAVMAPLQSGRFDLAVAQAATVLETTVRAVSDAPSDLSGTALGGFAFAQNNGRLTRHLPPGEAQGVHKLFDGLLQTYRNKTHHTADVSLVPQEAVQAISAISCGMTLARRLAHETYLKDFVSRAEPQSLLQVRHLDLDGDEKLERVVTFAEGWGKRKGRVIVCKEDDARGWIRVRGSAEVAGASFDGSMIVADCDGSGTPMLFATFGSQQRNGRFEFRILCLSLQDGKMEEIELPPSASISHTLAHEVKDVLGLGRDQVISYRQVRKKTVRLFHELNGGSWTCIREDRPWG